MKYPDVYRKEFETCRRLFQEKQGCNWGKCENCGVIPLLHKLETGEVVEKEEEVKKLKSKILN